MYLLKGLGERVVVLEKLIFVHSYKVDANLLKLLGIVGSRHQEQLQSGLMGHEVL